MSKKKSKEKPSSEFLDSEKRTWKISLTVASFKKILNDTGFNIGKPDSDGQIPGMSDIISFCEILYSVLEDQCKDYGLSPEEFAECMWGDTLQDAQIAFMESYASFCPSQQAKAIRRRLAMIQSLVDRKISEEESLSEEELSKQAIDLLG